jgi:hypothetical protein
MPGAPNRPPESGAPVPPAPPRDEAARRILRRLGPGRVALSLDLWKGAPGRELLEPLLRAEGAFEAGDLVNAQGDVDQLAVRFAEPRWPTLPEPFKQLRQSIPAPMPPSWDPDNALPPPEKEARRQRREAELQRNLVEATVLWARGRSIDLPDGAGHVERAKAALGPDGPTEAFWTEIDAIWMDVRRLVPLPKNPAARAPPAPAAAATGEA